MWIRFRDAQSFQACGRRGPFQGGEGRKRLAPDRTRLGCCAATAAARPTPSLRSVGVMPHRRHRYASCSTMSAHGAHPWAPAQRGEAVPRLIRFAPALLAECGPAPTRASMPSVAARPRSLRSLRPRPLRGYAGLRPATSPLRGSLGQKMVPCRSEEHTSELQSLMRISYAVFCLKKKKKNKKKERRTNTKLNIKM